MANEDMNNAITGFLDMLGLKPESIRIIPGDNRELNISEMFPKMSQEMSDHIKSAKEKDFKTYLQKCGLSDDRIKEIMDEAADSNTKQQEEKERKEALKKKEAINVVANTLKSIAAVYGYKLNGIYIENGIPYVENITSTNMHKVNFDMVNGFTVTPAKIDKLVINENAYVYVDQLEKAMHMCESLNSIDVRTWPVL